MSTKTKKTRKNKPKKISEKLTPNELILDYKIGISRSTLMELELKKAKLLEKIEIKEIEMRELMNESETQMTETLKNWQEFKKAEPNFTNSKEVIDYMKSNWKAKENEQERISATEEQIKIIQVNKNKIKEQIKRWNTFESNIRPSNNQFIDLLRQETSSMNGRYESLVENMEKAFLERKIKYKDKLQSNMKAVKKCAVDKVIMKLDKQHLVDVKQQDWLRKELMLLKERENKLKTSIEFFEKANNQMSSGLAHTGIHPLLLPKYVPENFSDKDNALYNSRILNLDLRSYFGELDLNGSQSVVDELTARELQNVSEHDLKMITFDRLIKESMLPNCR